MSNAVTQGIRVTVVPEFIPERSSPEEGRYAFAYTVRVANEGTEPAQLVNRHWIITDSDGYVEEVQGAGVVGHQPLLHPGEHFEYTSWCLIRTPRGTMHGTYQMVRPDGRRFDAEIAPFSLVAPTASPGDWLH
jgi:ApaG protein